MTDSQIIKKLLEGLYEAREIRNQSDFAKKTGLIQSLISQILSGKKAITAETIEKITHTFPKVNKAFLKGKSERVFTEVNYRGEQYVNEPQAEYGKDVVKELIAAKNEIIELLKEREYLKDELQKCLMKISAGERKEGLSHPFS